MIIQALQELIKYKLRGISWLNSYDRNTPSY